MGSSDDIVNRLKLDWSGIYPQMRTLTAEIYGENVRAAFVSLDVPEDSDLFSEVAPSSLEYASTRAAELVGRRIDDEGNLTPSPNPEIAITDSTREMLRTSVENALKEGLSAGAFRDQLMQEYAFSPQRALNIARTERNVAQRRGSIEGAKKSGVVKRKKWVLTDVHPEPDECDTNSDAGWIGLDEDFPEGDNPHPACACSVDFSTEEGTEVEGGQEDEG